MSEISRPPARAQILVVEDSSVFREMQGLLLRQAGYATCLVEDSGAAVAEAQRLRYDLVVIDHELPGTTGVELMQTLRALQPHLAVVFVTGFLTLELAVQLTQQGVAGIFNKPANPKALLEKIEETLGRTVRDTAIRSAHPPPALSRKSEAAPVAFTPPPSHRPAYDALHVFGMGEVFREFTHRLWKIRDFRATLLLFGEPGSPFEPVARELAGISLFREGPTLICDAVEFEPRRLVEILAPTLISHDAGTLIVTGVETFGAEQQQTLEALLASRDGFLPFARRFRVILAATTALAARVDRGEFSSALYKKIAALSLALPALRELTGDIAANARHLMQQHQRTIDATFPATLSAEGATWIERQPWPGNHAQLSRTLMLAARHAFAGRIDVSALEAGLLACEREAQGAAARGTPEVAASISGLVSTTPLGNIKTLSDVSA